MSYRPEEPVLYSSGRSLFVFLIFLEFYFNKVAKSMDIRQTIHYNISSLTPGNFKNNCKPRIYAVCSCF